MGTSRPYHRRSGIHDPCSSNGGHDPLSVAFGWQLSCYCSKTSDEHTKMNGDSRAEIQGRGSQLVSAIRAIDGDVGTVGETKLDKEWSSPLVSVQNDPLPASGS